MKIKPPEFSTKDHWKFFAEFCDLEQKTGGPDPQIPLVAAMSSMLSFSEQVWRGGCYISVYNVPFAEAIWRDLSWKTVQADPDEVRTWLDSNWDRVVTRFERRCVRRPTWMFEFFAGYHNWAKNTLPQTLHQSQSYSPEERYLLLWDSCQQVPRLGRYVALKLLEYLKQSCNIKIDAPDIRPKGGWSPRETLAELHPKFREQILSGDKPENHAVINKACKETITRLSDVGVTVDYFQLQVLLCEYRESYSSQKQYPGRSNDSELGYGLKAEALWPSRATTLWSTRKATFPNEVLGELHSWSGPRKELGKVLANSRYTWSDFIYDYPSLQRKRKPLKYKAVG